MTTEGLDEPPPFSRHCAQTLHNVWTRSKSQLMSVFRECAKWSPSSGGFPESSTVWQLSCFQHQTGTKARGSKSGQTWICWGWMAAKSNVWASGDQSTAAKRSLMLPLQTPGTAHWYGGGGSGPCTVTNAHCQAVETHRLTLPELLLGAVKVQVHVETLNDLWDQVLVSGAVSQRSTKSWR